MINSDSSKNHIHLPIPLNPVPDNTSYQSVTFLKITARSRIWVVFMLSNSIKCYLQVTEFRFWSRSVS